MSSFEIEFDNAAFTGDLTRAAKLKGKSNYLLWKNEIAEIFQRHLLDLYTATDEDSKDEVDNGEELDPDALSYLSACIQSTFHDDLNFYVWQELSLDSRKLWKELDDRFSPKGKWAYIRCSVKLNRMQPYNYQNDDQYCFHEKLLVMQRNATGVRKTGDIEDMIRIVKDLPDYLEYLTLKWCVAEEDDLTAAKMCQEVMLAEERYTMPEEVKSGDEFELSFRTEPHILGSESPEAGE
ncbi:hypothetical protein ONS95_008988 [Cadophora gregata]|uniref:uncharacterized protein n=1 Tax=Cadophora gregata TaxID=51156 RepID=UPI0026DDCBA9|nr:uncharacterized protein ONS95_008988 [Cadophora gregata]KAK0123999.1 hypothetical protein ONS95_008988 [Cadophora gregata]KAK0130337.1 hypothetical protein ONS96_000859 [Cadophora gregata f. sp. sojae]